MADERCILDPQRDCLGLQKAEMLEKQITQWRAEARETHREIYTRLNELEQSEASRDVQYMNILEKLDQLLRWQEEQKGKSGKRWESVVEKVLLMVVAAIVTWILAKIGL